MTFGVSKYLVNVGNSMLILNIYNIYYQGSNPVKESQISLNDFNIIKVIGRGSYAKVLMVSDLYKTIHCVTVNVIVGIKYIRY